MKKFTVLMLALLLVVAFTVPASALENIMGGYWRTRMFQQRNFSGDNDGNNEVALVDTRTRLYYTGKINDNLKLVNEFEMNTVWGSAAGYGHSGTDVRDLLVRITYADFKVGPVNFLVGAQLFTLARGFISDDTGIGMKAIWKVNDGLYLPFVWNKAYDGNDTVKTAAVLNNDVDQYIFSPIIYLSKDIKISPYVAFLQSKNGAAFSTILPSYAAGSFNNLNAYIYGVDFDAKFGPASMWFTGIMQGGTVEATGFLGTAGVTAGDEIDLKGYLVAAGGKFDLGKADIHGQIFMASGDDQNNSLTDKDAEAFITFGATTYYWAEIMGLGIFDNAGSTGSPLGRPTNILAANLGATFKPMNKLSVSADLWWAKLREKVNNADKLGLEADLKVTYQLVEGLNLEVVGAYLFAGDATSGDGNNDRDPYEVGTRLSMSF